MGVHPPQFIGLSAGESDVIQMLVDAHHGDAQVRLARVAEGVAGDQGVADPVAQQRAGQCVDDGRPEHEARDGVVVFPDPEDEGTGEYPQHPGEGQEQDGRLQQRHPEVRGQLAQVPGILVHALVGVLTHGPGAGQPERAARLQPVTEQVLDQGFAHFQLQHFPDPALRDIEHGQPRGQDEKHAQLDGEIVQIAPREGVVEGLVPQVQAYLDIGSAADDHESGRHEGQDGLADPARKCRARKTQNLGDQSSVRVCMVLVGLGRAIHPLLRGALADSGVRALS